MVMLTLNRWGYTDCKLTYKKRQIICKVACRLTTFDYRYKQPFSITMISRWHAYINSSIQYGPPVPSSTSTAFPLVNKHKGSVSFIKTIKKHPGHVRYLFCYTQQIHGSLSIFDNLATHFHLPHTIEQMVCPLRQKKVRSYLQTPRHSRPYCKKVSMG